MGRKKKYATEEERKQAKRLWNKRWREKNSNYNKHYYKNNTEKLTECIRQYYSTPMGRAVNLVTAYKQSDKKYNRGKCTLTAQWIMDNIFNSKCVYCRESDWAKLGCDRIDNLKPHTEDNVICCCETCNKKRGTKSFESFVAECNAQERLREWEEFLKQKDLEGIATT